VVKYPGKQSAIMEEENLLVAKAEEVKKEREEKVRKVNLLLLKLRKLRSR